MDITLKREEYMVDKYGECVKVSQAAKILNKDRTTINRMMKDGRLDGVCGGTMVCVHSIARYMDAPKQEDAKARTLRRGRKWAVV